VNRNGAVPSLFAGVPRRPPPSHQGGRQTALCAAAVLFLLALLPGQTFASDLGGAIAGILDKPAAQRAFWGVKVIDVESGEVVYEHNSGRLFVPASTAKLFSTAAGLSLLGPDHSFVTSVVSDAHAEGDGSLTGDLILLGGGDPNFSSRIVPYNPRKTFDSDFLSPVRGLARQVVQAGIRRIQGDIVGDDTRYVWQGSGIGWSAEDPTWGYGAPVSALSINDNVVRLRVLPASALGQLARADMRPEIGYYSLDNRVRTAQSRAVAQGLRVRRDGGSRTISMWGEISIRSTGREIELAIDDPALFAAMALKTELQRLGVEVTGESRARHTYPHDFVSLKEAPAIKPAAYARTLATMQSQPLSVTLSVINKVSQNLHAEMLLRELGLKARGMGSFESGLEELKRFLLSAGLKPWDFDLTDASGLSRQDLVTPDGMVQLLRHMWKSPHREIYAQSLPLAGEDGTLDWRFSRSSARGRIRAKTGTLTNITALSGYATAADGKVLAFSILANNFSAPVSYIRKLVDEICVEMIKERPEKMTATPPPRKESGP